MRRLVAVACLLLAAPVAAQAQSVLLVNRTGDAIVALSVSPASTGSWGPDLLGGSVGANGQAQRISLPPAGSGCRFDVRLTYGGGDSTELRNLDLCRMPTITVGADEEEETEFAGAGRDVRSVA